MKHVMSQSDGVYIQPVDRVFSSQTIVTENEWVVGSFVTDSVILDGPTLVPNKPDGSLAVTGHFEIGFGPDRITAIENQTNAGPGNGSHSDGDAIDHPTWEQDAIAIIALQIKAQGDGLALSAGTTVPGGWEWLIDKEISVGAGDVTITDRLVGGTCLVGAPNGMRFGPKEQRIAQRPTS